MPINFCPNKRIFSCSQESTAYSSCSWTGGGAGESVGVRSGIEMWTFFNWYHPEIYYTIIGYKMDGFAPHGPTIWLDIY